MADSSLDDFFAKKDKNKKSKKKNITTTTEDIAKKLEESGKRNDKQRKNKEKMSTINNNANVNILEQEDEEWNDFEEEREKDYTGLRIQTLTIKDKEEELREQMQENEEENKKESQSGPWKVFVPPVADKDDDDDKVSTVEVSASSTPQTNAPQTGGKYVPPAMRMSAISSSQPLSSTRKSKFGAPKIGDTNEFPTLGAPDMSEDSKGFQPVRYYGGRDSSERSSNVTVTSNKYGVLNSRSTERLNDNNSQ